MYQLGRAPELSVSAVWAECGAAMKSKGQVHRVVSTTHPARQPLPALCS